jgi:probable rRNA maturation factor
MNVVIVNHQRTKKINTRLLKKIAGALFLELKITEGELGINFIGTEEMAKVNWHFLQHEGSTDVITFDHREGTDAVMHPILHGELFICVDEAVLQAMNFKTSWQSEILRYVVHGVLHLLGHDDHQVTNRRKMKSEENRLLRLLAKRFSLAQLSGTAKLRA